MTIYIESCCKESWSKNQPSMLGHLYQNHLWEEHPLPCTSAQVIHKIQQNHQHQDQ